jgi:hypothetical protein
LFGDGSASCRTASPGTIDYYKDVPNTFVFDEVAKMFDLKGTISLSGRSTSSLHRKLNAHRGHEV